MNIPFECQTTDESKVFYEKAKSDFIKSHDMKDFSLFKIISLGYDCSVRTILTDWGLKPTKEMGELSYPFDLAFCPHKGMLKVLENNFADFFENLTFNKTTGLWENTKYGFYYNHDTDCGEQDRQKFMKRFKNRIDNFNNVLRQDIPIIFVAYVYRGAKNSKKVYKIFNLLKKQRKCKKNYLVLLNENKKYFLPKNVYSIHIKKPFSEYVWWRADMRYSHMGAEFERFIATEFYKKVQKIIKK